MDERHTIGHLQLNRLSELRRQRERLRWGWRGNSLFVVGTLTTAITVGATVIESAGIATLIAAPLALQVHRWLTLRLRLKARRRRGWTCCPVPGAVTLTYRFNTAEGRLAEWADVDLGLPGRIEPGQRGPLTRWSLLDERTELVPWQRALLGPALRWSLPRWCAAFALTLDDGAVRIPLEPEASGAGYARVHAVVDLMEGFRRRLEAPVESLRALALDLERPLDAARAFAALAVGWPAHAAASARAVADDPVHAALARVAMTGEGLLDAALSWPMRAAVGCGVLAVPGPGRDGVLAAIEGLGPQGVDDAMALADLHGAAMTLRTAGTHAALRRACLAALRPVAHPAIDAWVSERAPFEPGLAALQRERARRDVAAVSRVTEAQLQRLSELRAVRPRYEGPAGVVAAMLTAPGIYLAASWLWAGVAAAIALPIAFLKLRRVYWRRRLDATFTSVGFVDCRLDAEDSGLIYRFHAAAQDSDRLLVDRRLPADFSVLPGGPALLDVDFDVALGVRATPLARALLGPVIRAHGARWHHRAGFVIRDGAARFRLGAAWIEQTDPMVQAIVSATVELGERLANPIAALEALACDLAHPFDAARAYAALVEEAPAVADALRARLAPHPLGAQVIALTLDGAGMEDDQVAWADRAAMARGVLGIDSPRRAPLIEWLEHATPADSASAMAIAEIAEAAQTTARSRALRTQRKACLAFIVKQGGPECLAWLRARVPREAGLRSLVNRLSMRLHTARSGFLSLEPGAFDGALSDARAGEVALVEPDA